MASLHSLLSELGKNEGLKKAVSDAANFFGEQLQKGFQVDHQDDLKDKFSQLYSSIQENRSKTTTLQMDLLSKEVELTRIKAENESLEQEITAQTVQIHSLQCTVEELKAAQQIKERKAIAEKQIVNNNLLTLLERLSKIESCFSNDRSEEPELIEKIDEKKVLDQKELDEDSEAEKIEEPPVEESKPVERRRLDYVTITAMGINIDEEVFYSVLESHHNNFESAMNYILEIQ